MSLLRTILQVDMAKEVFSLPNRSLGAKAVLFARSYAQKANHVIQRRKLFARGRAFGEKLRKLALSDNLEAVPCPVCKAPPQGDGVDVWCGLRLCNCPDCGLWFISPRLSAAASRKLYTEDYYYEYRVWLGHPVKSEAQVDEILLGHKRFARAEMFMPPKKVLDVGCSTGEMLVAARERGWTVRGVDLNEYAVGSAREKYGLDVRLGPLSADTFPDEKFDLITMFDVIEHLPNPVEHMQLLKTLLKPNGLIVLTTPNAGCVEASSDLTKWKHLKPWEHICHYDSRVLKRLGKLSGFEMVDVDTELSAGVGYVGALMAIFRSSDFDIPEDVENLFVRAEGARGDTLLATPIIKGLHDRFPNALLTVSSFHPELLEGLDNVVTLRPGVPTSSEFTLSARYETEPDEHVIDVMSRLCCIRTQDRHLYYQTNDEEENRVSGLMSGLSRPVVCVHSLCGSRIKRWSEGSWAELSELFREKGFSLVVIGSKKDTVGLDGALDLREKVSLREAIAVVKLSDVFVGLDSIFSHASGAVKTPRVVLYGSTDPDRLACDLDVCKTIILRGECEYLGCRHDCLPDQWPRNTECRLGTVACMDAIHPQAVFEAVVRLISEKE